MSCFRKISVFILVSSMPLFPQLVLWDWPLEYPFSDGAYIANYVDQGDTTDYNFGHKTYFGHKGVDIGIGGFFPMDRGVRIVAVADGTIKTVDYSDPNDRGFGNNRGTGFGNKVILETADGRQITHAHMRFESAMVKVGEKVKRGQPLGFVGSSGNSSIAHLHIEDPNRDPFFGPNNSVTSLWVSQPPYVGFIPAQFKALLIFTDEATGGDPDSIPVQNFNLLNSGGISVPAEISTQEPEIFVRLTLTSGKTPVKSALLELVSPANQVMAVESVVFGPSAPRVYRFPFGTLIPDAGSWKIRFSWAGEIYEESFMAGSINKYPPRFVPIRGRSFRIDGQSSKYSLAVDSLGGPANFQLINAPADIGFDGQTVTIPASSQQTSRNQFFQAVATNAFNLTDTFYFHMIDPAKPYNWNVTNQPPTVMISADVTTGLAPLTVNFTGVAADGDGKIVGTGWDFGDSTAVLDVYQVQHVYQRAGNYRAIFWVNDNSAVFRSDTVMINVQGGTVAILNNEITIKEFNISPNPFQQDVRFCFTVLGKNDSPVSLKVFDLNGRLIKTLAEGILKPGDYSFRWDVKDNSEDRRGAGIYYAQLRNNNQTRTQLMLFLK